KTAAMRRWETAQTAARDDAASARRAGLKIEARRPPTANRRAFQTGHCTGNSAVVYCLETPHRARDASMNRFLPSLAVTSVFLVAPLDSRGAEPAPAKKPANLKYLPAKAYHVPPETTTEESGYFSLCEGKNGKIYIGTAAYGRNSYL